MPIIEGQLGQTQLIQNGPLPTSQSQVVSDANSTGTPLAANATFTGTYVDMLAFAGMSTIAVTDVLGGTGSDGGNALFLDWSSDGVIADRSVGIGIGIANSFGGYRVSFPTIARYFRVRYVNGNTPQTIFRLHTLLSTSPTTTEAAPLYDVVTTRSAALLTRAVLNGITGTTLCSATVNPAGQLSVLGPATNTELRATPLPVSGTVTATTGGLTDTQLRATAVPISGSVAVSNLPVTQPVSGTVAVSNLPVTQAVSGPLTDTQLRATAVPVSGTFFPATQPVSGTVAVSNFPASQAVTGTFFQTTQPTSVAETQTFGASVAALASVATATDIFTITGSASKTVKVRSIKIVGTRTASSNNEIVLLKRSSANSAGTSTTQTAVPFDSNNSAATAVVRAYTANPTTGTLVGNIKQDKIFLNSAGGASTSAEYVFDNIKSQPITLRGVGEVLAVNLAGVTIAGSSFDISVTWTEE